MATPAQVQINKYIQTWSCPGFMLAHRVLMVMPCYRILLHPWLLLSVMGSSSPASVPSKHNVSGHLARLCSVLRQSYLSPSSSPDGIGEYLLSGCIHHSSRHLGDRGRIFSSRRPATKWDHISKIKKMKKILSSKNWKSEMPYVLAHSRCSIKDG